MLMNVGLNSPRIEKYAFLYPSSTSLQKELCNYYAIVISLCTKIILFVRKPVVKQIAGVLRKPFEDEFGVLQKDINRVAMAVKEEVSIAAKRQQNLDSKEAARERKENFLYRSTGNVFRSETANELALLRKSRQDRLKSRVLNSCSKYNFETALNQARKKGASTWILEDNEYKSWKSEVSSSTLLCSGILGSGKTVLCASVVEDLNITKPLDSSLAFFFCRYDETESLKAREILGSLARQLLQEVPSDKFIFGETNDSFADIKFNTKQILSNMLFLLPQNKQYQLVLDGLDDCKHDELSVAIGAIQSLLTSPKHGFKLFWTGRSDLAPEISDQLRPDFQVQISSLSNGPGISRFIEVALAEALESGRLILRDPEVILTIREALEREAEGMFVPLTKSLIYSLYLPIRRFLWVAFQMDSICAQNTDRGILDCLEDLPKGLPTTFRRILRQLQSSAFSDHSLARKIFEIVAVAQRPLTLNELREAISIRPGITMWDESKMVNDVMKSLKSCGSFLVVDEEFSTVHFPHSSVKRYLFSAAKDTDVQDYHVDPWLAEMNLAEIVVTYLSLEGLGYQLARPLAASQLQSYAAHLPSHVMESTLPKHDIVTRALKLLRNRKTAETGPGLDFERTSDLLRERDAQVHEAFFFLPYCQEFWLLHTTDIYRSKTDQISKLWSRLVYGKVRTVELPWAPEELSELDKMGKLIISWIRDNDHHALRREAIARLWTSPRLGNLYSDSPDLIVMASLNEMLRSVAAKPARYSLYLGPFRGYKHLLAAAAREGYQLIVRQILQEGIDVEDEVEVKALALYKAVLHSQRTSIVRMLLNEGADVNFWDPKLMRAPILTIAAMISDMNWAIELLLEKGAVINARRGDFPTPLIAAASNGCVDNTKALLGGGADVNARGADSHTALTRAAEKGNIDVVVVLLGAGADVNARGGDLDTTALTAAAKVGNLEVVSLLLKAGADVNARGGAYDTALIAAAEKGNLDVVVLLLEAGADVNAKSADNTTAFSTAVEHNRPSVKSALLKAGADTRRHL